MPAKGGQLHEISEAIGEIRGTLGAIEKYIHDERHGVRNLSQKVDGLGSQFSREIATAEAKINAAVATALERVEARIQTIDERVVALERMRDREAGSRSMIKAILASPVIAWLFAAAVAVWTFLQTHGAAK